MSWENLNKGLVRIGLKLVGTKRRKIYIKFLESSYEKIDEA